MGFWKNQCGASFPKLPVLETLTWIVKQWWENPWVHRAVDPFLGIPSVHRHTGGFEENCCWGICLSLINQSFQWTCPQITSFYLTLMACEPQIEVWEMPSWLISLVFSFSRKDRACVRSNTSLLTGWGSVQPEVFQDGRLWWDTWLLIGWRQVEDNLYWDSVAWVFTRVAKRFIGKD
jgi:hypothetical protein